MYVGDKHKIIILVMYLDSCYDFFLHMKFTRRGPQDDNTNNLHDKQLVST